MGQLPSGYICLAVFRPDASLLRRQVQSLRAQTVSNWRCLIGIDGSDSEARLTVEEIIGQDDRFELREYPDNVGFYRNFERILNAVPPDASWIAMADQDDEWFSQKLEKLVPALRASSLAMGQAIVAQADGSGTSTVTRRKVVPLAAELIDNQVTGSACVIRGELLDVALPFPEATDLAFHDHWLGACAVVAGGIALVDEPLQYYLQHASNVIGEEGVETFRERLRRLGNRSGGGASNALRYLADHRWGWRVNMARALLDRSAKLGTADVETIFVFAKGRMSARLSRIMLAAVARKQAPWHRVVGLALGAIFFGNKRAKQIQRT